MISNLGEQKLDLINQTLSQLLTMILRHHYYQQGNRKQGTQVLSLEQLKLANKALVLADVNAVPPAGLEGVGLNDNDEKHACGGLNIGPLTSGDIKVKTQYKMFEKMCSTDKPLYLNFDEALKTAREILKI